MSIGNLASHMTLISNPYFLIIFNSPVQDKFSDRGVEVQVETMGWFKIMEVSAEQMGDAPRAYSSRLLLRNRQQIQPDVYECSPSISERELHLRQ